MKATLNNDLYWNNITKLRKGAVIDIIASATLEHYLVFKSPFEDEYYWISSFDLDYE